MLQEIALFPCGGVSQVDSLSPSSRNKVSVDVLLPVQLLVLESRVAGPHQIVQQHAGFSNQLDCLWAMLHGGEEDLEVLCKYA